MVKPSDDGSHLDRSGYLGVFLIALSTLMLEIVITRIFSVTMWYHFAFVAISIAMLGLSAGAVFVYLFPGFFSPRRAPAHMALFSILFALATAFSTMTHLGLRHWTADPDAFRAITFFVFSIPFVSSGVTICLALTKFPLQLSRLYASDLCGAAAGCVLIVLLLDAVGDAFSVIAAIGGLSGLAALLFARSTRGAGLLTASLLCTVAFFVLASLMAVRFDAGRPLVQIRWAKGIEEPEAVYERWNSYSRVKIEGSPEGPGLVLKIDGSAATALRRFDGDLREHQILMNQMAAAVHFLRPRSSVAIIGAGGGRDVLTAHVFGQRPVVGIEMNKDIVEALTDEYGAFTGHLDRLPGFSIVNDEARSYLARSHQHYDIIMATMIDTWAATAAGAFVLSENSLYTVEAWRTFLDHLSPRGILSFTRWYSAKVPGEMYRLMSLAVQSLREAGASDPLRHIAILREQLRGTIIVGKQPLTGADLDRLEELQEDRPYDLVHSPRRSDDPVFEEIATANSSRDLLARFPIDITAPTDDRPFFFNMLKFGEKPTADIMSRWGWATMPANMEAVLILRTLTVAIAGVVLLLIVLPLLSTMGRVSLRGTLPLLAYFAAIGLAFMLVEISQLQRLTIFLGHPTYSLSVVLFSLLSSSGLGSLSTAGIRSSAPLMASLGRMAVLLLLLSIFGVATPSALHWLRGAGMPLRIAVSVLILFPMGFFMGMAFPIGMKFAARHSQSLTPWLWGVNGATSVFASVLAVVIALVAGISAAFWVGSACYLLAAGSLLLMGRPQGGHLPH